MRGTESRDASCERSDLAGTHGLIGSDRNDGVVLQFRHWRQKVAILYSILSFTGSQWRDLRFYGDEGSDFATPAQF